MKTTIAVVIGVGLFLLCACAGQSQARLTPTNAALPTRSAVPTRTAPPLPTRTSWPDPTPSMSPSAPALAGEPFTYTLTITNHGPADATGVVVNDTLPADVLFVSATPSQGSGCQVRPGAPRPGLIMCALGELRVGAGAKITVVVMPLTTTRVISQRAIVVANETEINLSDNVFYQETTVRPVADLAIRAQAADLVLAGTQSVYTLSVHNRGPALATGIVLTDVLPPGLRPAWTEPEQPLCGQQGRVVSCDLGYVEGRSAATVTLDLTVSDTVALMSDPRLPGVALKLSAPTCAIDQDHTHPYVVCRLDRLAPGAEARVRIGVDADGQITGRSVHTATVAAHETDVDQSNNHTTITMAIRSAAPPDGKPIPTSTDLVLRGGGPGRAIAGQPFTYTFTITNQGQLDASGVIFHDDLPPGAVLSGVAPGLPLCHLRRDAFSCYLRAADSGETFTFTLAITGTGGQPMSVEIDPLAPGWPVCILTKEAGKIHRVDCSLGALPGGAAARVDLVVVAEGVLERTMSNTAAVYATEPEQNVLDNTATTTTSVQVAADLALQSVVSGPAIAGKTLDYVLTLTNTGPSDAVGVILADTLPQHTTLVTTTTSHGDGCSYDAPANTIACDLDRLGGGETATITVTVAVDRSLTPALTEAIAHFASVVADQTDPDPGNNQVRQSIPVSAEVDLSIMRDIGD
jgi:uncharacterized repeat protein (TIGR01451 family)